MGALSTELLLLRSQLEDAACDHERQLQSLRETCVDLQSRADAALKEVDEPALDRTQQLFKNAFSK